MITIKSEHSRIKPPLGPDNAWWWQQAAQGVLAIQRCAQCQTLRHPPRPMCNSCRSMDWDFIAASGGGIVNSYTVLHHPQFPGYDYPLIIILVDLAEGTRITSQLIDCEPDAAQFGMAVEMVILEDPDGFMIPVFRPFTDSDED
jgi:uncharacterized OB-fold protein